MAHEPGHDIPIDLDFNIEITPPSLPPLVPPKMPKGCFSLDIPVGGIMGFVRSELVRLETHIRLQVEGVKDQLEQQVREKIPTKEEIVNYLMGYGCEYEPEVTAYYNQLKKGLQSIYQVIEGVKAKIDTAIKTIDTVKKKIDVVETTLKNLARPLGILGAVVSAAKIAIKFLPPGRFSPPHALYTTIKDKIDAAKATICVMNGNISGIPQSLRVQADRLTEFTNVINPYIGELNALVAEVQEAEAMLEAAYLEWLARCNAGGNDLEVPPNDPTGNGNNPLANHYRVKIYAAITNNIDKYPPSSPNDWNELSNEILKVVPEQPEDWQGIINYDIEDRAKVVLGPPPPDETVTGAGGRYLIKYYAAIRDNIDRYPEISLQDWNLLRTINVNEIPDDGTPEWDGTVDYIVEDVVKIIIDLTEGSFNQTVSDTVASGGIEVIEKLYNAKFRMIGYKRYRE